MASNSQDDQPKPAAGFASPADENSTKGGSKKGRGSAATKFTPKSGSKQAKTANKKGKRMSREERAAGTSIIPPVVSNRMLRRGLVISGIPTLIAFSVIPLSYFAIVNEWFELPNAIVLGASLGGLLLGLLGISYSVLSASWDEDVPGSLLGFREFQLNLSRLRESRGSSPRQ